MNTKGSTQQEAHNRSVKAVEGTSALNEKEPPAFSDEFMNVMSDYAYETLRTHLERNEGSQEAVELLDNLMILQGIQHTIAKDGETIHRIWNDEACYCIAKLSHNVVRLGGSFVSPTGNITVPREV